MLSSSGAFHLIVLIVLIIAIILGSRFVKDHTKTKKQGFRGSASNVKIPEFI